MRALIAMLIAAPLLAQPGVYRVRTSSSPQPVEVAREEYVAAALAGEAGGFTSTEALKAMAVTIRTYARVNAGRHAAEGFDFCETTHCQKLLLDGVTPRLRDAAGETEGIVLTANGRPAEVFHARHCGGRGEAAGAVWPRAARPWLQGGEDTFCLSAGRQQWRARLPLRDLARALGLPELTRLAVTRRTASGRVATLAADRGPIDAEDLHLRAGRALGWEHLRSKLYDVRVEATHAIFEGWGAGHGVGLCQMGAEERGKSGHQWPQILAAYFPGTQIHRAIAWRPLHSETLEVFGAGAAGEDEVPEAAERARREAERLTGRRLKQRVTIRVYPTIAAFRDATGEPGFIAASTRGRFVRLQPPARLLSERRLAPVLLHEMLHLALAPAPGVRLPRWFEEGLALWFEQPVVQPARLDARTEQRLLAPKSERDLREAYGNARTAMAALVARHGRATVLGWLETGIPRGVLAASEGRQ
jgi:stage II sporulation protein D